MIRRVAVIVPAADEQDRIGSGLIAIERARHRLLSGVDHRVHGGHGGVAHVDVIVVLDGCRDDTAARVAELAESQPLQVLTSSARCVGAARRQGAQAALTAHLDDGGDPEELWLANTDADSQVPLDWLTKMVAAADTGAQLVLGTVLPGAELPPALRPAWLAAHRLQAGHPHVHGANLGLRADAYRQLGGWRAMSADEDIDLVARAVDAGDIEIVRTAEIPVITSARMIGRTPRGFSSYLRRLRDQPAGSIGAI
jgi:cellulose synthase/poly-beta-1,6-N-acetylglucosamine synthase-like glycosyltransferase